jgi:hypothetical protein
MIGEVGDAEDVVLEAFLRAHRTIREGTEIRHPKSFLSEIMTRLAIETCVGSWLPEPLLTHAEPDVAERAEDLESLSMAFLVVLERLAPVEPAVFLPHASSGHARGSRPIPFKGPGRKPPVTADDRALKEAVLLPSPSEGVSLADRRTGTRMV